MFFFAAGYNSSHVDHGHILPLTCPNCKQVTYWKMFERKSQVTVYFVPVSNSSHGHLLCCNACGFAIPLNAEQVQRAHWIKQVTIAFFNKQISDEEYKSHLEQIKYLH